MVVAGLLAFLLIFFLLICLVTTPTRCWVDRAAPFNLVLYREPGSQYTSQLVNQWVEKPWRDDGGRIPCRLEKDTSSGATVGQRTLVIYSHGQSENLLSCVQFAQQASASLSADILCYDYSGYGLNPPDSFERSEEGVSRTLHTVYQAMVQQGYHPGNIVLWGYSLGTGPSVKLAATLSQSGQQLKGLLLFGAFSAVSQVIKDHTHARVASLFEERWHNARTLGVVTCPVLLLHGQNDQVVNIKHAQQLKRANPAAKLLTLPNVGHSIGSWTVATSEVQAWLRSSSIN
jgi:pimeloyl-ACP methyl ester carboxylesterase